MFYQILPECSADFYDLLLYSTCFSHTLFMELSFLLPINNGDHGFG